jgi:DNA-binding NarL/FixJ family response regulator
LIAPNITARLLAAFADSHTGPPAQPIEPLTSREEEILNPVARGRTNRVEIAMWAHETGRIKT